jgi:hypothetical protein
MVFGPIDGPTPGRPLTRAEAAKAVGMLDDSMRMAFRNPDVMQHFNEQLEILRTSARPRAFAQIVDLSEHANAEATRFRAAAYVDSGGRSGADGQGVSVNIGINVQPGYVLGLDASALDAARTKQQLSRLSTIEAKPLEDKAPVAPDDRAMPDSGWGRGGF